MVILTPIYSPLAALCMRHEPFLHSIIMPCACAFRIKFVVILILGVAPQLADITSCIGDTVIYTCTVNSVAHSWIISSPRRIQTVVTVGTPRAIIPPYSFMLTEDDGSSITSTLSLTVFAAFNGTMITCRDSLANQGAAAEQSTTAMVLGECMS